MQVDKKQALLVQCTGRTGPDVSQTSSLPSNWSHISESAARAAIPINGKLNHPIKLGVGTAFPDAVMVPALTKWSRPILSGKE